MGKRPLFALFLSVLFLSAVSFLLAAFLFTQGHAGATMIIVDDSGGADRTSIQDAVDMADDGDNVYVRAGTYGPVFIEKQISIIGESARGIVIRGSGAAGSSGVRIDADYVSISNLTIDGFYRGICVYGSNSNISQNTINNSAWSGIFIEYGRNSSVSSNTINNSGCYGVCLSQDSAFCTLTSNTLANGGIFVDPTSVSTLSANNNTLDGKPVYAIKNTDSTANPTAIDNAGQAILYNCHGFAIRNSTFNKAALYLFDSAHNEISNNHFADCNYGIYLRASSNNSITSNTITNCRYHGICLYSGSSNTIVSNVVARSNWSGIDLYSSSDNTITSNRISDSGWYGVYISYTSQNNTVTLNAISNCSAPIYVERGPSTQDRGQFIPGMEGALALCCVALFAGVRRKSMRL